MLRLSSSKARGSKTEDAKRHESREIRESRRRQKKTELKITYENILRTLGKPEFATIDGASMEPFLKALFYYSMGDRSKPLPLPKPVRSGRDYKPILFPEGMTISSRNTSIGYEQLAKEFGELKLPDEDAVSSIVSVGMFADDGEEPARTSYNTRPEMSHPAPMRARGIHGSQQMNFASEGFGTRLSTPSVHNTNFERRFHTNGQQRSFGRGNNDPSGFADGE